MAGAVKGTIKFWNLLAKGHSTYASIFSSAQRMSCILVIEKRYIEGKTQIFPFWAGQSGQIFLAG